MVNLEINGFDYVGLMLKIDYMVFYGSETDNFRFRPEMRGRSKNSWSLLKSVGWIC